METSASLIVLAGIALLGLGWVGLNPPDDMALVVMGIALAAVGFVAWLVAFVGGLRRR